MDDVQAPLAYRRDSRGIQRTLDQCYPECPHRLAVIEAAGREVADQVFKIVDPLGFSAKLSEDEAWRRRMGTDRIAALRAWTEDGDG